MHGLSVPGGKSVKDIAIGIIGGTGGIGKWFADFFADEGYTVHVSGRTTGMGIGDMTRVCRVIIVSVPIGVTCDVIKQVGPLMHKDALLMDFTSLKEEPVKCMLESSESEVLGCHPLFGPDIPSLNGHNIVMCPARIDKWSNWPGDMFKKRGAILLETSPERHDEIMSVIQALNHLNTIMMGLTMKDAGLDATQLKDYATPLFKSKLAIVEKVFANNMQLYAEIITHNPGIKKILASYEKNLVDVKTLIDENNISGLVKFLEHKRNV